jgi:EmrB/QacA subfamily drug resistance transporter
MKLDNRSLAILATSLFLSLTFIDESGVAVTLPAMGSELNLSEFGLQWVMNSFFIALAVFVLAAGRLSDMVGHRKIFMLGLVGFLIGSVGAALSQNLEILVVSRAVQGIGASLMLATYAVLLGRVFPASELGFALGASASIAAFFLAAGPFIGGFLAHALSWRAIFWLNVPLSFVVWLAMVKAVPQDIVERARQTFDYYGFFTFVVGFGSIIIVLMQSSQWGLSSTPVITGLMFAFLALVLFVVIELRTAQPMADLRLFKCRDFLSANVILLTAQVNVMAIAFWAIWLQVSLGFSALQAGILLLPTGVPILYMARAAGRWADAEGARAPIRWGALLCLASAVWMACFVPFNSYTLSLPGMLLYGIGAPLVISPAIKAVLMSVPPQKGGVASGTLNTMRNLGAALCFGVVGLVISIVEHQFFSSNTDIAAALAANLGSKLDALHVLSFAQLQTDPTNRSLFTDLAQNGYAKSLGWGMWAVALFSSLGSLFAWSGLSSTNSQT